MQEKRTSVFQAEDGSWGHITQTVNPLICTIEYKCHSGFPSKEEAEESYQECVQAGGTIPLPAHAAGDCNRAPDFGTPGPEV